MTRVAVELSFDDGPDPIWTPAVLDALAAGAAAVFDTLADAIDGIVDRELLA